MALHLKKRQDLRGLRAGQLARVFLHNDGIDDVARCDDDKAL